MRRRTRAAGASATSYFFSVAFVSCFGFFARHCASCFVRRRFDLLRFGGSCGAAMARTLVDGREGRKRICGDRPGVCATLLR